MISFLSYDTSNMAKCAYRLHLEWENLRDHAPRSVERTALKMSRNRRGYRARAQPCAKHAFGGSLRLATPNTAPPVA